MTIPDGSRRPHRRRHRRAERRRELAAIVFVTLLALATVALISWPLWRSTSPAAPLAAEPSNAASSIELASVTTTPASSSRPIYKYSVIPGGAHSREELADAISHDPVVASHYRSVSPERVRVERLTETRRAYVSYRIGDRVYWTKHQVTLPAGELILTDGVTQIRARCGNCISDKAKLPTSAGEPDSAELDTLTPVVPPGYPLPRTAVAWNNAAIGPTGLSASLPGANPRLLDRREITTPLASNTKNAAQSHSPSSITSPVGGIGRRFDGLRGSIAGGSTPGGSTPGDSTPEGISPAGSSSGGSTAGDSLPDTLIADAPSLNGGHASDWLFPDQPSGGYRGGDSPPDTHDVQQPPGEQPGDGFLATTDPIAPLPVPEPSTIYLLTSGVVGALWRRRRSRRLKTTGTANDDAPEAE